MEKGRAFSGAKASLCARAWPLAIVPDRVSRVAPPFFMCAQVHIHGLLMRAATKLQNYYRGLQARRRAEFQARKRAFLDARNVALDEARKAVMQTLPRMFLLWVARSLCLSGAANVRRLVCPPGLQRWASYNPLPQHSCAR